MKKYCVMPFVSVRIEDVHNKNSMGIRPCCYYKPRESEVFLSLEQYLESDFLKKLQQHFLTENELPSGCESCRGFENNNLMSVRKLKNQFFNNEIVTSTSLREIDLFPSNVCNLHCLMCGPKNSSAIAAEQKKLGWIQEINNFDITDQVCNDLKKITNLEYMTIAGGELFYFKNGTKLLNSVVDSNVKNLLVFTNGTKPDPEQIELLNKINNLIFRFSIDGANEHYEVIRYPSQWEELKANVSFFKSVFPNAKFECNIVLQPLNVFSIFDLLDFCYDQELEIHISPIHGKHYSWSMLNENEKKTVTEFLLGNANRITQDTKTKLVILNWAKNVLPKIEYSCQDREESLRQLSTLRKKRKVDVVKVLKIIKQWPLMIEDFQTQENLTLNG